MLATTASPWPLAPIFSLCFLGSTEGSGFPPPHPSTVMLLPWSQPTTETLNQNKYLFSFSYAHQVLGPSNRKVTDPPP